jgi:apolipoprotein N-acyltransferase
VTLIQGNVPQNEKFEATYQIEMLGWHAEQLMAAKGDLVMAPETVIPLLPADLPQGYWHRLRKHFHKGPTAGLFGLPLGSFAEGYTNSVAGISPYTLGQPGGFYRYNKHHLVPFGEFIPWGFKWFVRMMNMPLGDFSRGPVNAPSFEVAGQWIAPNICYEDLFGEDLAARFVSGSTLAPTILANVSNLAWFGKDVAIYQHLQIARLRSMEFQRPTLRATNTGATVVIDHQGQVVASQPPNTRGALVAQVQGTKGLTPFAVWAGGYGLWPLIVLAGAVVLGCARGRGAVRGRQAVGI